MKNNIIFLIGVSDSGKSTFATNFLKENQNYLRINRDLIRQTLVGDLEGYYQRIDLNKIESIVNRQSYEIMIGAISYGYNLLVDNTNLKKEYFEAIINNVETFDYSSQFKFFDIDINIAKRRVHSRDFLTLDNKNLRDIPETKYIDKQYQQYQEIKKYIMKNYESQIIQ